VATRSSKYRTGNEIVELEKRTDGWWIEGAEPYHIDGTGPRTDYGPYRTKAEAAGDLRGLRAFERLFLEECPERGSVDSSLPQGRGDDGEGTTEEARHQSDLALAQTATSPAGV
jgi:hypothetical protein